MVTKVKLRKKPISGNRQSLYLDFYPAIPDSKTGEPTRREFLGLYIYDEPKKAVDKHHNKETVSIAEHIRQNRDNYFYFIQERMKIFWRRYEGSKSNLTDDPILARHKFTNVYRAQDRVSQYLIRNIISEKEKQFCNVDNLLRIIVFKIFNNINTSEYLERRLGEINIKTFNVDLITALLDERIKHVAIFSPAYMMTGSHAKYNMYARKHEKWLRMVEKELLLGKGFERIVEAKSLEEVYNILLQRSFIGEFLAFQYSIDFNYSSVINFDENSFVKAGIGAIRGIKKCFLDIGQYTFEDCIRFTQDNFHNYRFH